MKIGIVFGNPETTTGGNALKFYSSVRVEVRKGKKLDSGTGDDKEFNGNEMRVKVVKNKVAPPFKTALVNIMFNKGISREGDLLETGVKMDVVTKAGAFYSYNGTKLGQGKMKSMAFLEANPDLAMEIEKVIVDKVEEKKDAGKVPAKKPVLKKAV